MTKYIFSKTSDAERPLGVSKESFIADDYGTQYIYEPKDTPLRIYNFLSSERVEQEGAPYLQLKSLKNIINYYKAQDDLFDFNKFYGQDCALFCFYSSHFGSGLKPGTIQLNIYYDGMLLARAEDSRQNGVLYQADNDKEVGIVLYREGFILLNNTDALSDDSFSFQANSNSFDTSAAYTDFPKWIYFGMIENGLLEFEPIYGIKSDIATNLNFVYAEKQELNHSNNSTYIESGSYKVASSNKYFKENSEIKIKNTIKSPFISGSAQFEKQTFITRIGLYDEEKKLIAVGSLANPIRKTENREYVFKLKIDI